MSMSNERQGPGLPSQVRSQLGLGFGIFDIMLREQVSFFLLFCLLSLSLHEK